MRHILEEIVASKVDVVNDLAKVFVEVSVGQVLEIVESILGNIPLPLQFACVRKKTLLLITGTTITLLQITFAFRADCPQVGVFIHPLGERHIQLQAFCWR